MKLRTAAVRSAWARDSRYCIHATRLAPATSARPTPATLAAIRWRVIASRVEYQKLGGRAAMGF